MLAQRFASRALPSLDGHCYYTETAHERPLLQLLQGSATADACVVGGGIAGLSAALALARSGVQVTLLEARRVADGASGRNGGQALPDFACGIEALERRLGNDAALRAWELSQQALRLLRQRITEYGIDCDWRFGALTLAPTARQARRLRLAMQHRRTRYGAQRLQWLDATELRARVHSDRYAGGVLDPDAGHLHPLNYTLGLAHAAREAGVRMHEHSAVRAVRRTSGGHALETAHARLDCRLLLLATGAVPGAPLARLRARVLPVATCMLATEALREPVLPLDHAACDTGFIPDYFRSTPDGRLLFGGGALLAPGMPWNGDRLHERLRRSMLRVFPQLRDTRVAHHWGGWIDASANRAPDFGHLGPSAVYVQGFSGHGLALAGLAGELAAQALLGGPGCCADFELFARLRHASLPTQGVLRIPVGVAGSLWGRLLHTL